VQSLGFSVNVEGMAWSASRLGSAHQAKPSDNHYLRGDLPEIQ